MEKLYYDETASAADLAYSMAGQKDSTFSTHGSSMVGGVTTSVTDGDLNVLFVRRTDESGNTCLYVSDAMFKINYQPAIFVSKEFVDKECSYEVVRTHELQHVKIDIEAIQDYIPYVKKDVLLYLRSLGYNGFGPFSAAKAEEQQRLLIKQINEASRPMLERLREARRKRQGEIDTIENYRKEAAKCPQDHEALFKQYRASQ